MERVMSRGYSLIEVMVYMTLLLILSVVLGRMAWQIWEYSILSNKSIDELLRRELFFDVLRRDMLSASPEPGHWDEERLVFRKETLRGRGIVTRDVGFIIEKGKIFRVEGNYDFDERVWIERKKPSLLADKVASMRWRLKICENKICKMVRSVSVFVKSTSVSSLFRIYLRLRNGFL